MQYYGYKTSNWFNMNVAVNPTNAVINIITQAAFPNGPQSGPSGAHLGPNFAQLGPNRGPHGMLLGKSCPRHDVLINTCCFGDGETYRQQLNLVNKCPAPLSRWEPTAVSTRIDRWDLDQVKSLHTAIISSYQWYFHTYDLRQWKNYASCMELVSIQKKYFKKTYKDQRDSWLFCTYNYYNHSTHFLGNPPRRELFLTTEWTAWCPQCCPWPLKSTGRHCTFLNSTCDTRLSDMRQDGKHYSDMWHSFFSNVTCA